MVKYELIEMVSKHISKDLVQVIQNLGEDEKKVLEYFLQNVSVGVIISVRELKALYKIDDPRVVIRKLIDKGLIEQGYGCYSLSRPLREALFMIISTSRGES